MSAAPALKWSDVELFKYMHDTAGKYHLHYSNVRTTATSLILPIGILASVNLLIYRSQASGIFAILFIIFIYLTTIVLNVIFTRWSRACRHLERYYELKMTGNEIYKPNEHGFRHIFRQLIISKEYPSSPPNDFPKKLTWGFKTSADPFVIAIIIFGAIYVVGYILFILLL